VTKDFFYDEDSDLYDYDEPQPDYSFPSDDELHEIVPEYADFNEGVIDETTYRACTGLANRPVIERVTRQVKIIAVFGHMVEAERVAAILNQYENE
jgi:hypothetical protein